MRRAPCKVLGVGKSLCIQRAGSRLHKHKAQGHQNLWIGRRGVEGFPVRHFSIVPSLLIDQHISDRIVRARIA
ncbi:MAG TPA: hypothetical protein VES91_07825, partial [Burkholderiaceae bacterium]|nr:hypothetical protein [Burkholderiaceae bacterium]